MEIGGKFSEEKRNTKTTQDLIDNFLNNQYKNIQRIADDFENITNDQIKGGQKLVLVLPTAFYNSLTSELSSKGYGSIAAFYRYSKELKHKFSMYYRWKKFHTKETRVENFIKGEENIFYSRPLLPPYILLAVIIYAVTGVGLFLLSLVLNRRAIYQIAKEKFLPRQPAPLYFDREEYKILEVEGESFKDYLLNLCIANTAELKRSGFQYPGKVYLDEEEISAAPGKNETLYIPPVESIPGDIRVYDLLAYFSVLNGNKGKAVKESLTGLGVERLLKERFWGLDRLGKLRKAKGIIGGGDVGGDRGISFL